MKSVIAVLFSVFCLSVSADSAPPNTGQLVGEWVFDIHRFARQRLGLAGLDVEAAMQNVESSFSDSKMQENLLRLTITDSHLIFHENAHNPRRVQPYKIIGGNSALAIVEYLDEDNIETIAHIHIDADGISFANPGCDTYAKQCARQKARYMNRVKSNFNTKIDGAATSVNSMNEAQLEQSWQEQLSTPAFFKPATNAGSAR